MLHNNENNDILCVEDDLFHSGTPHDGSIPHSGRYPWGSGENAFQRPSDFYSYVGKLKRQGVSETDIAQGLGMSTTQLRAYYSNAKNETRKGMVSEAKKLSKETDPETGKEYTREKIGVILGNKYNEGKPINESTVRSYLDSDREARMNAAVVTSEFLMKKVDELGIIDVGVMVNKEIGNKLGIGISQEKMKQALVIAESKGYVVIKGSVPQLTNPGQKINIMVLAPAGTPASAAYDYKNIHQITDYKSTDNGYSFRKTFVYPKSMDPDRLAIRYAEDGGKQKDGLIEIRRGVKDLSLGGSHYAQVRILVDNGGGNKDRYLKGMAVYTDGKDMPDGIDVIFNTNKPKGLEKMEYLKKTKDNLAKDPDNPFGSTISAQSYYDDPKGKYKDPITGNRQSLSLINKRSDEGEWQEWSKEIPSQLLSKQPKATIGRQLTISIKERQNEFDEILNVTNPTVKAKLLEDFANDCDASAVELKAASFDGTRYHVIIPGTTISDNEIYAPNFKNGTQLALVRFPHGGTFEIPILTVNNNLKEGIDVIGPQSVDAVMINSKVAARLSGADFDGDTVLTIPTNTATTKIKSTDSLKGLEDFDTGLYAPDMINGVRTDVNGNKHYYRNGIEFKHINETYMQRQMGIVSNLISDMSLHGATEDELARAVRHSMVIIDSYKHDLDYKSSEIENKITDLKIKYQKHSYDTDYGGASTLISRAKSTLNVNKLSEGAFFLKKNTGNGLGNEVTLIDPEKNVYLDKKTNRIYGSSDVKRVYIHPDTGVKLYHETLEAYTKIEYTNSKGEKVLTPAYIKDGDKYRRPKYNLEKYKDYVKTDLYYMDENNNFVKVKDWKNVITKDVTQKVTKMAWTDDARSLSSGLIQEEYYAEYANKLKAMANKARLEYLYYDKHPIPYSPDARKQYEDEVRTLTFKLNQAELNAPKERAAQLIASSNVKAKMDAAPEQYMTPDSIKKLKQSELTKSRINLGAHNMRFIITEKEWNAIQNGAFSKNSLIRILRYADQDVVRELATPRQNNKLSDAQIRRIKGMASLGETNADIARRLGVSVSTVTEYLNGKE